MSHILQDLSRAGVSIWLDDLSRERLETGSLLELVEGSSVVGVTTNPAIFQAAIAKGDGYDPQVRELVGAGAALAEVIEEVTTTDVRDACDVLRPAYEATSHVDGRVSIEVSPDLAHDRDATVAEAERLWAKVDRPNLFIKIPATEAGYEAITATLAAGISVNVTLIFGLQQYRDVMEAYLRGLEQARENGHDLAGIHSVASFFVSRVDTEIDARLEKLGADADLQGKAGVANARLAFQAFEDTFRGPRWDSLAVDGANLQRPLWASTGVKNPAYRDTMYVDDLVTAGTVNTMPEKTLDAVRDHGVVEGDSVRPFYADAASVMADLATAGIDYDDVIGVLIDEGVEKFVVAWREFVGSVEASMERARA